jgi:hypothetical protein
MLRVGWPGYKALWWRESEKREASRLNQSRTLPADNVRGDPSPEPNGQGTALIVEKEAAVVEPVEEVSEPEYCNLDGRE